MMESRVFNPSRFIRLVTIDLGNYWRKILLATGMVYAFGMFLYINISTSLDDGFSEAIFITLILASGALFTSVIFNDMHHPLQRYQFMTLPCSALERFISKFLLTGPLFLVYTLVAIALFEALAPGIYHAFSGKQGAFFVPFTDIPARFILMFFFMGHILFLTGAIVFRSYAVVKTGFSLFALPYTFFFISMVSLKIIYFDHFDSFWTMKTNVDIQPGIQQLLIRDATFQYVAWTLVYLWLTYMAYTCLQDHEA